MISFMRICNIGVLLVSNGKFSCDLIRVMTRMNTHELDTRMHFMIYGIWINCVIYVNCFCARIFIT